MVADLHKAQGICYLEDWIRIIISLPRISFQASKTRQREFAAAAAVIVTNRHIEKKRRIGVPVIASPNITLYYSTVQYLPKILDHGTSSYEMKQEELEARLTPNSAPLTKFLATDRTKKTNLSYPLCNV